VTWDHNKELHLAMRALRAELNRIASQVDKQLKWFDKAIADWEREERAGGADSEAHRTVNPAPTGLEGANPSPPTSLNPPLPARPDGQVLPAGTLLPGVFCVCGEPAPCPEHPAGTFRLTEQ
jgi:hypothetical protein